MITEIYKESNVLKSLKHRNIIQLHKTFLHKTDIVLIMEVCAGGELKKLIQDQNGLSEFETRFFTQ
jgi:serine/threonine protein kinase